MQRPVLPLFAAAAVALAAPVAVGQQPPPYQAPVQPLAHPRQLTLRPGNKSLRTLRPASELPLIVKVGRVALSASSSGALSPPLLQPLPHRPKDETRTPIRNLLFTPGDQRVVRTFHPLFTTPAPPPTLARVSLLLNTLSQVKAHPVQPAPRSGTALPAAPSGAAPH